MSIISTQDYEKIAQEFIDEELCEHNPVFHNEKFYLYNGKFYMEEKELAQEIRDFLRKENYNQSNNIVGNIKPIVENICRKKIRVYSQMPFYYGTNQFPDEVLIFQNGILDLKNLLLMEHDCFYVSTFCLPYEYQESTDCPQWKKFLNEVFEEDECKIRLLQEWFGYCLNHKNELQKTLLMFGLPRSGKGTTMKVLEALVGKENTTGYDLNALLNNFGLFPLLDKQIAFIGEINLGGKERTKILEKWKSIIGQDAMLIEEKMKPQYSRTIPVKFVAACNEMPVFNDPSGALSSRLLILEYTRTFMGHEDKDLINKLVSEISGICNWSIEGLVRLREQGKFTLPDSSRERVNDSRRDNSEAFAFLQDCVKVERRLSSGQLEGIELTDDEVWISAEELETEYKKWLLSMCKNGETGWLFRGLKALLPKMKNPRKSG